MERTPECPFMKHGPAVHLDTANPISLPQKPNGHGRRPTACFDDVASNHQAGFRGISSASHPFP